MVGDAGVAARRIRSDKKCRGWRIFSHPPVRKSPHGARPRGPLGSHQFRGRTSAAVFFASRTTKSLNPSIA
jgi:hypothetical protein